MNNLHIILIIVVAFLLLGCSCSCKGMKKENFGLLSKNGIDIGCSDEFPIQFASSLCMTPEDRQKIQEDYLFEKLCQTLSENCPGEFIDSKVWLEYIKNNPNVAEALKTNYNDEFNRLKDLFILYSKNKRGQEHIESGYFNWEVDNFLNKN